jgi:hypothetical protein
MVTKTEEAQRQENELTYDLLLALLEYVQSSGRSEQGLLTRFTAIGANSALLYNGE